MTDAAQACPTSPFRPRILLHFELTHILLLFYAFQRFSFGYHSHSICNFGCNNAVVGSINNIVLNIEISYSYTLPSFIMPKQFLILIDITKVKFDENFCFNFFKKMMMTNP